MSPREKVRETIQVFWETKKLKAQIELEFQQNTFQPKAMANLEELKGKLETEEKALKEIEGSHTREDREKRTEIEGKIKNINAGLKAQDQEIERSNKIIEQAPWVISEADIYLEIIDKIK